MKGHIEKALDAERVELQTNENPVELSVQSPQVGNNMASVCLSCRRREEHMGGH